MSEVSGWYIGIGAIIIVGAWGYYLWKKSQKNKKK